MNNINEHPDSIYKKWELIMGVFLGFLFAVFLETLKEIMDLQVKIKEYKIFMLLTFFYLIFLFCVFAEFKYFQYFKFSIYYKIVIFSFLSCILYLMYVFGGWILNPIIQTLIVIHCVILVAFIEIMIWNFIISLFHQSEKCKQ